MENIVAGEETDDKQAAANVKQDDDELSHATLGTPKQQIPVVEHETEEDQARHSQLHHLNELNEHKSRADDTLETVRQAALARSIASRSTASHSRLPSRRPSEIKLAADVAARAHRRGADSVVAALEAVEATGNVAGPLLHQLAEKRPDLHHDAATAFVGHLQNPTRTHTARKKAMTMSRAQSPSSSRRFFFSTEKRAELRAHAAVSAAQDEEIKTVGFLSEDDLQALMPSCPSKPREPMTDKEQKSIFRRRVSLETKYRRSDRLYQESEWLHSVSDAIRDATDDVRQKARLVTRSESPNTLRARSQSGNMVPPETPNASSASQLDSPTSPEGRKSPMSISRIAPVSEQQIRRRREGESWRSRRRRLRLSGGARCQGFRSPRGYKTPAARRAADMLRTKQVQVASPGGQTGSAKSTDRVLPTTDVHLGKMRTYAANQAHPLSHSQAAQGCNSKSMLSLHSPKELLSSGNLYSQPVSKLDEGWLQVDIAKRVVSKRYFIKPSVVSDSMQREARRQRRLAQRVQQFRLVSASTSPQRESRLMSRACTKMARNLARIQSQKQHPRSARTNMPI